MTLRNKYKVALTIGQAPPLKKYPIPLLGTRLYQWLEKIDVPKEKAMSLFDFDALADSYPGKSSKGHKVPSNKQIENHKSFLVKKIYNNNFQFILPIGKLAIHHVLGIKEVDLKNTIGKMFIKIPFNETCLNPIVIIPLPHPSSRSIWSFDATNKRLLFKALTLIKEQIVV